MDIDLLLTPDGQAGLVSDKGFASPVAGAMFDAQTFTFSLEFADMDSMELNIPLDNGLLPAILYAPGLQVGVIEGGQIEESWQVPLLLINDPERRRPQGGRPLKASASVLAFEKFLRQCVTGQPVHRENLGDESSADSVMSGMNRAVLQFAPHLARQKTLEAQPHLAPAPSAPGMAPGGGGGTRNVQPPRQSPPRRSTSEDEQ